jgi:acetone carboxylase gamma subunit
LKNTNRRKSTERIKSSENGRLKYPTVINRSYRKNDQKANSELINMLDQIDIIDIYRVLHPISIQYTLYSAVHGTFSKLDHSLGKYSDSWKLNNTQLNDQWVTEGKGKKLRSS